MSAIMTGASQSFRRRGLVAVAQLCSTLDTQRNIEQGLSVIRGAAQRGCQMVFLPETSDFIGTSSTDTLERTRSLSESPFLNAVRDAAKQESIAVAVGVHETGTTPGRTYNTQVVVDTSGQITGVYRKLHLFDVDIKGGPRLIESDLYQKGDSIEEPVDTPVGKIGLNICYDLRFPLQAMRLADMGADILTYPSAFTVKTGAAHWETLLRARAIENQCYVIAAAQAGVHNEKRHSYGHAMIVDPWGVKVAETSSFLDQEPQIAIAEIDLESMKRIRAAMPLRSHRRPELYAQSRS